jgi:transcriptional regulator with PAS, ATPase and Fis domain
LSSQSRLLRFLDDRVVTRLGDDSGGHCVDVRIIATTNCNLEARVQEGAFREDLFRRLRHWRLMVPPLRDRPADVEELARRFLDAYQRKCPELCDPPLHFDAEAIDLLRSLPWPGNIRELREAVENVAAFGEPKNGCITQDTIVRTLFVAGNVPLTAERGLSSELGEDSRIHRALTLAKWDISKAARIAGCSRGTIYARIKARGWARP